MSLARVIAIASFALLGACPSVGDDGQPGESCSPIPFAPSCNGVMRSVLGRAYCLHVPPGYREGTRIPVVMMLHGYASDGQGESTYLGLDALADGQTFLLVKPNGTSDNVGLHYWNASPACCTELATNPPDDVAFLMAVLDDVESAYTVDVRREYVMGHSSGAFMTQRLACEHGSRFAAAMSFAGAADLACAPEAPIAMLIVHGVTDPTVAYEGGSLPGRAAAYPSVEESLAYWRDADGCDAQRTDFGPRELVCDSLHDETHVERYAHCMHHTDVELWRMEGVGHLPAFRLPTWPALVMEFLFAHQR